MTIWNPELERLERSQLRRLQSERLREAVGRAYRSVPFYRERFDRAGVTPQSIRGLEDLQRIPFTQKQDLRDNYPDGLFAVPRQHLARIHASSGTRGKPTVVGYTQSDLRLWAEVCARSFCLAGGRPGDMFHNAYGYGLFTGGLGMHYGAEQAGATVIPISGGNTARQLLMIQDFRPRGIACTPSYALNLADAMDELGQDPAACSLEFALCGAEPWSESLRQQLETRLGLSAMDVYGLSEIIGPGVSTECWQEKDGLHIQEDHFLPEVIDPVTGEPLPAGAFGELVFTSLTKEASPAIRYRTGDIAALYQEPCRCGRTTVRMSRVKGRADDMLVIRGVNLFPSEVEFSLLQMPELAPHYQLVVDRSRALDTVQVLAEPSDALMRTWGEFDPGGASVGDLEANAGARLSSSLGVHVRVTLVPRGGVPRSEGKAIRVIDRRAV